VPAGEAEAASESAFASEVEMSFASGIADSIGGGRASQPNLIDHTRIGQRCGERTRAASRKRDAEPTHSFVSPNEKLESRTANGPVRSVRTERVWSWAPVFG
jgi:hypothetical protein